MGPAQPAAAVITTFTSRLGGIPELASQLPALRSGLHAWTAWPSWPPPDLPSDALIRVLTATKAGARGDDCPGRDLAGHRRPRRCGADLGRGRHPPRYPHRPPKPGGRGGDCPGRDLAGHRRPRRYGADLGRGLARQITESASASGGRAARQIPARRQDLSWWRVSPWRDWLVPSRNKAAARSPRSRLAPVSGRKGAGIRTPSSAPIATRTRDLLLSTSLHGWR